ncbi:TetR/AcrR family transcriptional regulator, partial [Burkholderia cenocepacia]|uniref:TetR/AcrR family transcriptional regulator n=1 Tax=Burkholderia cenocepacia TaxID=95486 RepID=UPI0024B7DCB8
MARPRSPDKHEAILAAAARALAEDGASATTARIAKLAGVAEGTVFTYFETKDALLNALYLSLKADLRDAMMTGFPEHAPAVRIRDTPRHIAVPRMPHGLLGRRVFR